MRNRLIWAGMCAAFAAFSGGCSSPSKLKEGGASQTMQATAPKNNPAGKYLELVGFRIKEKSPGKLEVSFGVVNHSEADLGDLSLTVNLRTTASKPDDPPLLSFQSKVSGIGPQEMKEATASLPSKLRVYELPDWQFIRSDFRVAEPGAPQPK